MVETPQEQGTTEGQGSKTMNMMTLSKQMRTMSERMDALQAENDDLRTKTATPMARGSELTGHTIAEVEAFLNKEPDPHHLFAKGVGPQLALFNGTRYLDPVTQVEKYTPELHIKDLQLWTGPGHDIPNPKDPTRPKFELGHIDLNTIPVIKNGPYKIEEVVTAIEASQLFQTGMFMWEKDVIEDLREEYADLRQEESRRKRIEARLAERRAGAHKLGEMAPVTEEESKQEAVIA